MSITPLYAGFFGILLVALSWRITAIRNKYQSRMTEEGHTEMTAATRAQGHMVEYMPTGILLMLIAEFQDFSPALLHALGILLIIARLLHLKGLKDPSGQSIARKAGTRLTWLHMVIASAMCIAGSFGIIF
jgi:uncharacterized membrane protein YecN with MAPEG domain